MKTKLTLRIAEEISGGAKKYSAKNKTSFIVTDRIEVNGLPPSK